MTAAAGIFIAGEATAKATDFGAEATVTYAISQADTEEAQSYADLVITMVEWGLIGLSTVGVYKWVKGKAPALRNAFSRAKISELFRLSRAKKAGANHEIKSTLTENSQGNFILTPYKEGKGHHIRIKSGYKSHPLYNLNEALCLSNEQIAVITTIEGSSSKMVEGFLKLI